MHEIVDRAVLILKEAGVPSDRVGAVDAQRCRRHDDAADLVMLNPFEHAALVHVPILYNLVHLAHRRQRDAVLFGV